MKSTSRHLPIKTRHILVGVPLLWLTLFFLLPFLIVAVISLRNAVLAQPPYSPLWSHEAATGVQWLGSIENYRTAITDSYYLLAFGNSLWIAVISTLICLLLGYPMAYVLANLTQGSRTVLLLLLMLPFWTSFLIRIYAWVGLLKDQGLINNLLMTLHIIDQPLVLLYSNFAVFLGIVYAYLPFMVLPIYAVLVKMDRELLLAAQDLGCKPWQAFYRVTLPLSIPGIVAGALLVFIPVVGEFVIPDLLGGSETLMIGKLLWSEFFTNHDWPLACALTVIIILLLVTPIMIFQRFESRNFGQNN